MPHEFTAGPVCSRMQTVLISSAWDTWTCVDSPLAARLTAEQATATNAVEGPSYHKSFVHADAFGHGLSPYAGPFNTTHLTDFLGFIIADHLYCNPEYMKQENAHAIRVHQCKLHELLKRANLGSVRVQTRWPVVSEEYQEYANVLSSATSFAASMGTKPSRPYTFVELGCGYGHWTFSAHRALLQHYPQGFPHRYLLVDVFDSMRRCMAREPRLSDLPFTMPAFPSFRVRLVRQCAAFTSIACPL